MNNMNLTKKEHENLKGLLESIKLAESAVGQLELQKSNAVIAMRGYMESLEVVKKEFTEKYGDISIDIATGDFTKTDEETK